MKRRWRVLLLGAVVGLALVSAAVALERWDVARHSPPEAAVSAVSDVLGSSQKWSGITGNGDDYEVYILADRTCDVRCATDRLARDGWPPLGESDTFFVSATRGSFVSVVDLRKVVGTLQGYSKKPEQWLAQGSGEATTAVAVMFRTG